MSASGFTPFETLAVVGLGLIGGSFAKDVRRLGLARRILGYDNNAEYRTEISSRNLVDYLAAVPDKKITEAQLILLAVPVKAFAKVISQIRPHLSSDAVLTDVGSVCDEPRTGTAADNVVRQRPHYWLSLLTHRNG